MDSGISEQSRIVLTLWDTLAINGVMLFRGFYTQYGKKTLDRIYGYGLDYESHFVNTFLSCEKEKVCLDWPLS